MKNPAIARRRLTEDCGSKVRGYVRDLSDTYPVRVPGTGYCKVLVSCDINSLICFWFMPSLYLVRSTPGDIPQSAPNVAHVWADG